MTALEENINTIVTALKAERDVLAVKIHFAKAEVREEWDELEKSGRK